jgi:hypothetical protein
MAGRFQRTEFFARMREAFGPLTQQQVEGAGFLLTAFERDPEAKDLRHIAYAFATAWHETGRTLMPIKERGTDAYFDARYDPVRGSSTDRRAKAKAMGNTREGDGRLYAGRGLVQVTWKSNYRRLGDYIGIDLVAEPNRALEPGVAYVALAHGMRLGWYGRKLADCITPQRTDYVAARATVNGTDRAAEIADHAIRFERALGCAAFLPL